GKRGVSPRSTPGATARLPRRNEMTAGRAAEALVTRPISAFQLECFSFSPMTVTDKASDPFSSNVKSKDLTPIPFLKLAKRTTRIRSPSFFAKRRCDVLGRDARGRALSGLND